MSPLTSAPLSGRYLSIAEREEIAVLRARECGVCEIARQLGRSPSTISRELRRNAATRGGGMEYRATTAQWHADRRARRAKAAKLASNEALRRYVQDRLAGAIATPDGAAVPGPHVRWNGRRHGRRQPRRWATAWSPEQISSRLRFDSPRMRRCESPTKPSTRHSMSRARRATPRADGLPAYRTGVAGSPCPHPRPRQEVRHPRGHDQPASGRGRGSGGAGPLGGRSHHRVNSSAIGTLVERTTRFILLLICLASTATGNLGFTTGPRWLVTAPKRSGRPSQRRSRRSRSSYGVR
jgi:transposase-like protein